MEEENGVIWLGGATTIWKNADMGSAGHVFIMFLIHIARQ
jgi:hypothetical protein